MSILYFGQNQWTNVELSPAGKSIASIQTESLCCVPVGGGSSAGVLAGAWAPGGMWMLLKLVLGGPDGPDPGLGVKPIPGA